MTITLPMQGTCDARFTAVREVFAENFAQRGDVGAAVCVYVEGKPVVDLWGGYANASRTRPWERHTIASVASTTKGMVAICAHLLVERGLLDLDGRVGFGYVMNQYKTGTPRNPDLRWPVLVQAVYASLGAQ
jgi:CubicO group peptidase (beta-lactamase class C family)